MLRLMLLILMALFAAFTVVVYVAMKYLPWWGVALTIVGMFAAFGLAAKIVGRKLVTSLFMIPFKAKGAVLRKAVAEVHAVERAEAPPGREEEPDDGEVEPPSEYYRIDVTITPRGDPATPFKLWEPGELMLVPFHARISLDDDPSESSNPELREVEIFQEGSFGPDEAMKYFGPQRLRLLVAARRESPRHLKFRYYFEGFGEVRLPQGEAEVV